MLPVLQDFPKCCYPDTREIIPDIYTCWRHLPQAQPAHSIPSVWRSLRGTQVPQPSPGATSELPQAVCNTWNFRYNAPAIYGSHCCGGRAARGFIFPAVIKFRACWPKFQLCPPLACQAGHLRVRLPPAHLYSHCCCQESGLEEANELLGIYESQFQTLLAKRQPKPRGKGQ